LFDPKRPFAEPVRGASSETHTFSFRQLARAFEPMNGKHHSSPCVTRYSLLTVANRKSCRDRPENCYAEVAITGFGLYVVTD